jgi:two-component system nitrate/nitrite response regulator NarL
MLIPMEKWKVSVCDAQPVVAEGLRSWLNSCTDLIFAGAADSLRTGLAMVQAQPPDLLIVDKGFGLPAVLDWIAELRRRECRWETVVWGNSISESEALRLLQSGVKGLISKSADLSTLLSCLRTVASGSSWMENSVFFPMARDERYAALQLTPREQQVLRLVEQGLKNREIGRELGIRPGTVKIHLKHIFEKTGVRGRYGLALSGLQQRCSLPAVLAS